MLQNFTDRLDAWIASQSPSLELRLQVTEWVLSRFDDPYQGVHREPGLDNYWLGIVPGSQEGDRVVTCLFWIFERTRTVRCDTFATLCLPL